jgi:RHS repeat-associated protein
VKRYVHGAGIDEILVQTQGSTDAFYHHDALGSTVLLTNASGNIVRSYEYDVFGQVSNPPSVDNLFSADPYANRFLYTGREFLKEANLYDYRNRVYSAELGRFLQTDPIRFDAGDGNLYRYVGNNPLNKIDPTGLISYAPGTCIEVSRCKGICKCRCWCPPGYSMGFTSSYTTQPSSFTKPTRTCFRLDSWDYAIVGAALLLSQLDSLAPGPADAGAAAILGARGLGVVVGL